MQRGKRYLLASLMLSVNSFCDEKFAKLPHRNTRMRIRNTEQVGYFLMEPWWAARGNLRPQGHLHVISSSSLPCTHTRKPSRASSGQFALSDFLLSGFLNDSQYISSFHHRPSSLALYGSLTTRTVPCSCFSLNVLRHWGYTRCITLNIHRTTECLRPYPL